MQRRSVEKEEVCKKEASEMERGIGVGTKVQ